MIQEWTDWLTAQVIAHAWIVPIGLLYLIWGIARENRYLHGRINDLHGRIDSLADRLRQNDIP